LDVEHTVDHPIFHAKSQGGRCSGPAAVRVMVQVRGDDLRQQDGRWWAGNFFYGLNERRGEMRLVIPLAPEHWSNVLGHSAVTRISQFRSAVERVGNVGLTFGGCSHFGHGVWVSGGEARMFIRDFSIQTR